MINFDFFSCSHNTQHIVMSTRCFYYWVTMLLSFMITILCMWWRFFFPFCICTFERLYSWWDDTPYRSFAVTYIFVYKSYLLFVFDDCVSFHLDFFFKFLLATKYTFEFTVTIHQVSHSIYYLKETLKILCDLSNTNLQSFLSTFIKWSFK